MKSSILKFLVVLVATFSTQVFAGGTEWDEVKITDSDNYSIVYYHNECSVKVGGNGDSIVAKAKDLYYHGGTLTQSQYISLSKSGEVAESSIYGSPDNTAYNVFERKCSKAAKQGLPASVRAKFHGLYGIGK